jgi:hypothetical protein
VSGQRIEIAITTYKGNTIIDVNTYGWDAGFVDSYPYMTGILKGEEVATFEKA